MSAAENSVRADLEAAMKAHVEPPEVEAEVVEAVATEVETEVQKQERARDEKGRFAAKSDVASDVPAADASARSADAAKSAVEPEKPVAEPEKPEAAPTSLAPPNGWSAEAKAKWHELPPEIMSAVQKREQDIAKFTSTRDEHASFGKDIYQAVQPYMATIKAEGGTPRTAIESLLNTAYVLRTGSPEVKKQLLLQTAQQFGVDLRVAPSDPTKQTPPEIASLQQEIAQLKGMLTQQQQSAQQQLQTEVQTEIEAFAADPKHTHYAEVKAVMAALLRDGLAKDLQDAYDQAVWARPDLRATLLAQQRAEEEQKRSAEAKRKAEEAKRKSISITGGPGNTAAAAAPGGRSIRDELEAAMAASSGAV